MLETGKRETEKQGVPIVMVIVDAGSNVLTFSCIDNALLVSINITMDKAFTAVFGKLPTLDWSKMLQGRCFTLLFIHERWISNHNG